MAAMNSETAPAACRPPIALALLTGCLGAGKTSLLNHWLALPSVRDRKLALIINEFGTLGIDGMKVASGAHAKFEINRGSLFCICIQTEFVRTLTEIAHDVRPDLVLVEATGVADPCDIEQFLETPALAGRFRVQSSVCVVDAENFTRVAAFMQSARRQVAWSDGLAINKTDLVEPCDLRLLRQVLYGLNPRAPQVEVTHGRISEEFLLSLVHERRPASASERPPDDLVSVSLKTDRAVGREAFREAIARLGANLLRLKGVVRFPDGSAFVEVVHGRVTERPPPAESKGTAFVAIGWRVSRTTLETTFRRTVCRPRPR